MQNSNTNILLKIFAAGFYRQHAGIMLFGFLVMVGAVEPSVFILYHVQLMLTFMSSLPFFAAVMVFWILYVLKAMHFVHGRLFMPEQQFLFYSTNAFSRNKQIRSWIWVQTLILLPLIIYALLAVGVGVYHRHYVLPVLVLIVLALFAIGGALFYVRLVNRKISAKTAGLLAISSRLKKPYFSLFIYYAMDKMKVGWLITKLISWGIITMLFWLFADVANDERVAGIAVLAIATAHVVLIFNNHKFEQERLGFARNLPFARWRIFAGFALTYLVLVLPEAIWLFLRYNPLIAIELLVLALSFILFFHMLLYRIRFSMDTYLQWVLGLFIVLFWMIMFRVIWLLAPVVILTAYTIFYSNYYRRESMLEIKQDSGR